MKQAIFTLIAVLLISGLTYGQSSTATDFTVKDCAGTSHNLFTELDSGKVVVLVWVMPCASCINMSRAAYTEVQKRKAGSPGKILYYMMDDYANTSCNSVKLWAKNNGMGNADAYFSNDSIRMTDYGQNGMPKVVVVGGSSHKVYFVADYTMNLNEFKAALDEAGTINGVEDEIPGDFQLNLFPNPATDKVILDYTLSEPSSVNIEVYNTLGEKVKEVSTGMKPAGKNETGIETQELAEGIYFIKFNAGKASGVTRFVVSR